MNMNMDKKNKFKKIRVIGEIVIVALVLLVLLNQLIDFRHYAAPQTTDWQQTTGFVALSYQSVGRTDGPARISAERLEQHLQVMKDAGYVTISQADIVNFYDNNAPLPDKALFLMFEDGLPDTYIQVHPLLEKFNYKATILSYGVNMQSGKKGYLQPQDLRKMVDTGYWELGTNGIKIRYINVFDNKGNFLGLMQGDELAVRDDILLYNQYALDFIRDENLIPVENRAEMEARIADYYTDTVNIYEDRLGEVPGLLTVMNSNVFGGTEINPLVDAANLENIQQTFDLAFARDDNAFNSRLQQDKYHLTRLQPTADWTANHLMMRLSESMNAQERSLFYNTIPGDLESGAQWELKGGALEASADTLTLTTPYKESATAYLVGSENADRVRLTAQGMVEGIMGVYLQFNRELDSYLRVLLVANSVVVQQKRPDDDDYQFVLSRDLPARAYAADQKNGGKATARINPFTVQERLVQQNEALSVSYPGNLAVTYELEVTFAADQLTVVVDGKQVVNQRLQADLPVGGVALASEFYRENRTDPVYDVQFTDIAVTQNREGRAEKIFDNVEGLNLGEIGNALQERLSRIVDWAVRTF